VIGFILSLRVGGAENMPGFILSLRVGGDEDMPGSEDEEIDRRTAIGRKEVCGQAEECCCDGTPYYGV
jgi:hypothetical protein